MRIEDSLFSVAGDADGDGESEPSSMPARARRTTDPPFPSSFAASATSSFAASSASLVASVVAAVDGVDGRMRRLALGFRAEKGEVWCCSRRPRARVCFCVCRSRCHRCAAHAGSSAVLAPMPIHIGQPGGGERQQIAVLTLLKRRGGADDDKAARPIFACVAEVHLPFPRWRAAFFWNVGAAPTMTKP